MMTSFEKYQKQRAESARSYLASPAYAAEMKRDKIRREARDRFYGHIPQCTLTKCHPDCKRGEK
jgi:hypothetical protein